MGFSGEWIRHGWDILVNQAAILDVWQGDWTYPALIVITFFVYLEPVLLPTTSPMHCNV